MLDSWTPDPIDPEALHAVDESAVDRFSRFLSSLERVFVLTGAAGIGKTRLCEQLGRQWTGETDFQFHGRATWTSPRADLATEILRYASIPAGSDSLLTLERAARTLLRPCLVVLDGVMSEEHTVWVGRQLDAILRQADSNLLRFVVVARTPPEPDFSAFPILAATIFGGQDAPTGASHRLAPWPIAQTREWWDHTRTENDLLFSRLPVSVQALARTPLYLQMLRSAGSAAQSGTRHTFQLIDHCVRTILSRSGQPVDAVIDCLAHSAGDLSPELIPTPLQGRPRPASSLVQAPPFVEPVAGGAARFTHDIFREYFLAIQIADQIADLGRSSAAVAAFNNLADRAAQSAQARNVFELAVRALDLRAPHLIETITSAPSVSTDVALPMLLETTAADGGLADHVVRACATRALQSPNQLLTQALLAVPNLVTALGDRHAKWVVEQLRSHGSSIWDDIAHHLEAALDIQVSARIADLLKLDHAREASFIARHVDLFASPGDDGDTIISQLVGHLDWRVRAALATPLRSCVSLSATQVDLIVERMTHDGDYKVRAALARVICYLETASAHQTLEALLTDPNWHVRECALYGILDGRPSPLAHSSFAKILIDVTAADKSWITPPASVAKLRTRILLLSGAIDLDSLEPGDPALLGLLKEVRSGWTTLPGDIEQALVSFGKNSTHWLTAQASAATEQRQHSAHEQYRRRRGHRSLQVALDVHTLDQAVAIATIAAGSGVDFLEVGDPLIKRMGVAAIETIKHQAPQTPVVAEMMSADWGRDQVELAAEAGADVVLLIGPASIASVSAAVAAARRLGIALTLDVSPGRLTPAWLRDMERTGIDGFVVTTNIDLGVGGDHPLATAALIRGHSQLPVAVSGGFTTADAVLADSDDWDIAILGRSASDAVLPTDMAYQLQNLIRRIRPQERL
ncbi:orotidine 5'-phosphate decarboxylase / HUMPS family protein [Nocardia sp. NPDC060259]|uniref:orotidine 5'-phosphate decarboxylase / HUMPS family protein n=1 Tax=Nocardia sp. NPDC060259 TaxID=3347088 RepID=UPI0036560089